MIIKKKKSKKIKEIDEEDELELINKKLEEIENNRKESNNEEDVENLTLEEEVKQFASENPEQVTELINSWLNE